jgi:hypothetical protein
MKVQIVDLEGRTLIESNDTSLVRAAGHTMAVCAARDCLDAGDAAGASRYENLYHLVTEATESFLA